MISLIKVTFEQIYVYLCKYATDLRLKQCLTNRHPDNFRMYTCLNYVSTKSFAFKKTDKCLKEYFHKFLLSVQTLSIFRE